MRFTGGVTTLKPVNTIVLVGPEGQIVCERCEIAQRFLSRIRGLLGRPQLIRPHGMLIRPTWAIHKWFRRAPTDVVFLDRDLTVLEVRHQLRSWRTAGRLRAHSVLELAAGDCERLELEPGDRLAWGSLAPER